MQNLSYHKQSWPDKFVPVHVSGSISVYDDCGELSGIQLALYLWLNRPVPPLLSLGPQAIRVCALIGDTTAYTRQFIRGWCDVQFQRCANVNTIFGGRGLDTFEKPPPLWQPANNHLRKSFSDKNGLKTMVSSSRTSSLQSPLTSCEEETNTLLRQRRVA